VVDVVKLIGAMTARSRSAGLINRGSVPDLRRVVDLHRHSVTLTAAQHHQHQASVDHQPVGAPAGTGIEADGCGSHGHEDHQLTAQRNGVVSSQQQQLTAVAVNKLDDVFKITEHVAVSAVGVDTCT